MLALLYIANETGFHIGRWRGRQRPAHERDIAGIDTITAGMLGLLAFTLGLTINIAQARFETHRNLVNQEANTIGTAWLRSKLVAGAEGPVITALIEAYAQGELAYVSANSFDVEPGCCLTEHVAGADLVGDADRDAAGPVVNDRVPGHRAA